MLPIARNRIPSDTKLYRISHRMHMATYNWFVNWFLLLRFIVFKISYFREFTGSLPVNILLKLMRLLLLINFYLESQLSAD